jgi:hypothetical protein
MAKILLTPFLSFFLLNVCAQHVYDETAFIEGNYAKEKFASLNIARVHVTAVTDGTKINERIFSFDEKGQVETLVYINGREEYSEIYFFEYGDDGLPVKRIFHNLRNDQKDTVVFFREYDHGKMVKDSSSEIAFYTRFVYTEMGFLKEKWVHYPSNLMGEYKIQECFENDETGRVLQKNTFSYEGNKEPEMISSKALIYDTAGRLVEEKESVVDKFSRNAGDIVYTYDVNGYLKTYQDKQGKAMHYEHLPNGLLIKKISSLREEDSGFALTHTYKYVYEDAGG